MKKLIRNTALGCVVIPIALVLFTMIGGWGLLFGTIAFAVGLIGFALKGAVAVGIVYCVYRLYKRWTAPALPRVEEKPKLPSQDET